MMKKQKISLSLVVFFILLFLVACGSEDATPTTVQPASVPDASPTVQLPATNAIATPLLESATLAVETPALESGSVISGDDFLPIDEILSEIDNDTCQNAYETKAEIEALTAEGADLAELETAVDELIQELENCPTPTPMP